MSKLLSVSVASYNVEKTLGKALDSMTTPEILPRVEVFIVDDGAKDGTAALAQTYVDRYPDSFTLIRKENGGYGSTINASIARATGKYFRVLDGDDWFDAAALNTLLNALEGLDADIVLTTGYLEVYESGGEQEIRIDLAPGTYEGFDILQGEKSIGHHRTTFRTECLRKSGWTPLLEHCFYTDEQYMFQGLCKAESIAVVEACPYCYRLGSAGQSVSVEGYARHYKDGLRCHRIMNEAMHALQPAAQGAKRRFLLAFLANSLQGVFTMFLCLEPTHDNRRELIAFHRYMLRENPDVYAVARARKVLMLRYSGFLLYGPLASQYKRKLRAEQRRA